MNWHAVQTKPQHERVVELSLQRLGVEAFCPQLKQQKVIRRLRQTVIGPLFPGYLFARFDANASYRAVNYARGAQRVVMLGGGPAIVEDNLIESIRARMQDGAITIQPAALVPGETVRILDGPLQGFEALFEREMSDDHRVVLLLQALSYKARIVIDRECVEQLRHSTYLVAA